MTTYDGPTEIEIGTKRGGERVREGATTANNRGRLAAVAGRGAHRCGRPGREPQVGHQPFVDAGRTGSFLGTGVDQFRLPAGPPTQRAAEAAAAAAADAAEAAAATAVAAKGALAAMALAETSAAKTAAAAKAAALSTQADSADADAETSMAEVDEAEAHERYRDATTRAAQRDAGGSSGSTT